MSFLRVCVTNQYLETLVPQLGQSQCFVADCSCNVKKESLEDNETYLQEESEQKLTLSWGQGFASFLH